MNVLDVLQERGFIENVTHEEELKAYLSNRSVSCYIGFDPTANSLHVGSLVPIMSLAHMQRCGHRPIALVGGGTGMIGDPSGKTEMRLMLTSEIIDENKIGIKKQLTRFIEFGDKKSILVDNADWLTKLEYIPFLREIGRHFSVNRMVKAESYKMRMESDEGLTFIEFNYMLLQAYDFLKLSDDYDCMLQMGGSDQWGNIVAGVELIRRARRKTSFGITFPLITTSSGIKMGKTHKGAVWLDSEKTSPYDYYQFWVNTEDKDVARFLALFTFLPMSEINDVSNLEGADLNSAKSVLAFEATLLAHGEEEAVKAYRAAVSMFGTKPVSDKILQGSTIPRDFSIESDVKMPQTEMEIHEFNNGIPAFKLFFKVKLAKSGGAARKLIEQGGAYINGVRLDAFDYMVTVNDFTEGEIMLRAGKKRYHRIKSTSSLK